MRVYKYINVHVIILIERFGMTVLFNLILFRKYNQIGFEMAAQGRVNNRGREREREREKERGREREGEGGREREKERGRERERERGRGRGSEREGMDIISSFFFILEFSRLEEDLLKSPREKLSCIINAVTIVISILNP